MKIYLGTIHKYTYPEDMSDEEVIKLLGEWRGQNVLKRKTKSARALPFCAGLTLKDALWQNKVDLLNVELSIGGDGKPFIKEIPFNLSHSGEVSLVAVSDAKTPIGCDIQAILKKPVQTNLKIAERFFSVNEYKKLQEIIHKNEELGKKLFYLIFSAKEAYIKYTGEGLRRGLESFEVPMDDELISCIEKNVSTSYEIEGCIDGENLRFTYLFPAYIKERIGTERIETEYVSVICEKSE